jgi:hypothetical protein
MVSEIYSMTCLSWFFPKRETLDTAEQWVAHLLCKQQISLSNVDPEYRLSCPTY